MVPSEIGAYLAPLEIIKGNGNSLVPHFFFYVL